MIDPELIDRCAAAVWHEWTGRRWNDIDEVNRKLSRSVARRVLAEAPVARDEINDAHIANLIERNDQLVRAVTKMRSALEYGLTLARERLDGRPASIGDAHIFISRARFALDMAAAPAAGTADRAVELLRELVELDDEPHPHGHGFDECCAYQDDYRLRHDRAWERARALLAEIDGAPR